MASTKGPRVAATYRAARRNQVFRVEHTVWRGTASIYRPFQIKPPVVKMSMFGPFSRIRPQPKTYNPNGKRECARRAA